MTGSELTKAHPDYSAGFFDAQANVTPRRHPTPEYRAGWDAFKRSEQIFREAGLSEEQGGTFRKTFTIPGASNA